MRAIYMAAATVALALVTRTFSEAWPWIVITAPIMPEKYSRGLAGAMTLLSVILGAQLTDFKLATALAVAVAV